VRTGFRAAAGPRVGLCVLPPARSSSEGHAGWGRVGMRPSVRARVVREGVVRFVARFPSAPPHLRASTSRSRLPAPPQT